jgi:hypothetical protein
MALTLDLLEPFVLPDWEKYAIACVTSNVEHIVEAFGDPKQLN